MATREGNVNTLSAGPGVPRRTTHTRRRRRWGAGGGGRGGVWGEGEGRGLPLVVTSPRVFFRVASLFFLVLSSVLPLLLPYLHSGFSKSPERRGSWRAVSARVLEVLGCSPYSS